MPPDSGVLRRMEKELHAATRPFEEVSVRTSWWYAGSTFGLLLASIVLAAVVPWWPLRIVASVLTGLLLVRTFISFTICCITRFCVVPAWLESCRICMDWPPSRRLAVGAYTHNFHHAHVGKPVRPSGVLGAHDLRCGIVPVDDDGHLASSVLDAA